MTSSPPTPSTAATTDDLIVGQLWSIIDRARYLRGDEREKLREWVRARVQDAAGPDRQCMDRGPDGWLCCLPMGHAGDHATTWGNPRAAGPDTDEAALRFQGSVADTVESQRRPGAATAATIWPAGSDTPREPEMAIDDETTLARLLVAYGTTEVRNAVARWERVAHDAPPGGHETAARDSERLDWLSLGDNSDRVGASSTEPGRFFADPIDDNPDALSRHDTFREAIDAAMSAESRPPTAETTP